MRTRKILPIACCLPLLALNLSAAENEPSSEQVAFFEKEVRPILAENCFQCHGEEKQRGSLRLDHPGHLLAGGDSGPAVEPGDPDASLLIEAINYDSYEMPPTGQLPDEQIATLIHWVKMGAPWPGIDPEMIRPLEKGPKITEEDRQWWAFQPVADPTPPEVDDQGWARTDIDRFIYRRLDEAGLTPAPQADKLTLMRRLYCDLIGLPPSPEEIEVYLADTRPDAYGRLVDRLLESPRYGEKWARHWLDLVRYAESDGYRADHFRPEAWRYRDYVIKSFNDDKPYDQFVMEQLAGDEIDPGNPDALTATMYLRHWIYEHNQRDVETQWHDILNDITDVTGDVFLAMGMGCARCHDHKYDPILQRDYYRLQAFFTPLLPREEQPVASLEEQQAWHVQQQKWEEATREIRRELYAIEGPVLLKQAGGQGFEKFIDKIQAMLLKVPEDRTPYEEQIVALTMRQLELKPDELEKHIAEEKQGRWKELRKQLASFDDAKPQPLLPTMKFGVSDVGPVSPPTTIPGSRQPEPIEPGWLMVLDSSPAEIPEVAEALQTTGRRTALAQWIASPENPLSTRVIVNRVWQHHFGQGMVPTSSDFGHLGKPPSHPDLLDWLTSRFLEGDWRLKPLHRMIVTSSVYRQSSRRPTPEAAAQSDPDNRLLWRMNFRRLQAEAVRDCMLATSGELQQLSGGPSASHNSPRRTVYTKLIRNSRNPLLMVFDGASPFSSTPQRNATTTPIQSLLMLNNDYVLERARKFADRLASMPLADDAERVDYAYRAAFGRLPDSDERQAALSFLEEQAQVFQSRPMPEFELSTAQMAGMPGTAVAFDPASSDQLLAAPDDISLPSADFTVEAYVQLDSLYQDATVRTIAAHWDSDQNRGGWALGVTSKQSAYTPKNLILQLVGNQGYEVIPSGLHLQLDKPYFVAVSVHIGDVSSEGIRFYLKDLTTGELQTAQVAHRATTGYRSAEPLTLGGRSRQTKHRWHGLIGPVRLSNAALTEKDLLIADGNPARAVVGHWCFENKRLIDASSSGNHLRPSTAGAQPMLDRRTSALADFCHVLINSSEFLYYD